MSLRLLIPLCLLISGLYGYIGSIQVAKADIPPCTNYECKTIHAYWDAVQPTNVYAFHKVNLTDNYNNNVPQVFTDTSTEKDPPVSDGAYDGWVWDSCLPKCGKSVPIGGGAATWQSKQEVTRAGNGWSPPGLKNQPRSHCTPAQGGNGVPSQDQRNWNDDPNAAPPTGIPNGGGGD